MRPFPGFGGAAGRKEATFVGALAINITSASQAISFPVGTKAGDHAIIMLAQGFGDTASISGGAGGWTKSALAWNVYSYYSATFKKALASGDLAGVTLNGWTAYTAIVVVYRDVTAITEKSVNLGEAGGQLTLAGFTKDGNCLGLVSIVQDRDPPSNPSAPTNFTMRAGPGGFGNFTGSVADLLSVGSYTNGAAVVWSDFITSTPQVGWLLELT